MNRYLKIALPVGLGCTLFSVMLCVLYGLVITLHAVDPTAQLPFFYFQKLNFPVLAVLLPLVGIVALLPVALQLAFAKETEEAVVEPVTTVTPALAAHEETHYLKAA